MNVAIVPARMGSQRLPKKNLRTLGGVPLVTRALRKCLKAEVFDEVWLNSEDKEFEAIAESEGVKFHHRPSELGSNVATSEQYLTEFLEQVDCDYVFQVHSIAPLLTSHEVRDFVSFCVQEQPDVLMSVEEIQIECAYQGEPVNFTLSEKTNSQELSPVQRITWSLTGWKRETFMDAARRGHCATYSGNVGYFPVSSFASHIIKTERDLRIAEALLPLVLDSEN